MQVAFSIPVLIGNRKRRVQSIKSSNLVTLSENRMHSIDSANLISIPCQTQCIFSRVTKNFRSSAGKSFLRSDLNVKHNLDFTFLSETWSVLTESTPLNFNFMSTRMGVHKKGGGVAILFNILSNASRYLMENLLLLNMLLFS